MEEVDKVWRVVQEAFELVAADIGTTVGVLALAFVLLYFIVPRIIGAWKGKE